MNNRLLKGIVIMLICALSLFGFTGCKKDPPVSGGTTDKTDYNAPKEIKSKDITRFHASFLLSGEWSEGKENSNYIFEVKKDENGVLTATERTLKLSEKADKNLLVSLQEIIDEQKLVKQNGVYRVTAGLPPEYQECSLTVNYTSGESLYFTINNNPRAEWAKQVYLTFANWFSEKGNDSLMPPDKKGEVKHITVSLKEDEIYTLYSPIKAPKEKAINGEQNLLLKDVYSYKEKKTTTEKYALFPEDYYDKTTEIINKYDLRPFDISSVLYGTGRDIKEENNTDFTEDLQLHITYSDDSSLNIDTSDKKDIKILKPLINELFKYNDSLFK